VPLSEDEKRILEQMEQRLYAEDPASAERISSTTLPRFLARRCRWASLGFLAGLLILLVSLAVSWVLGLVGFVVMVVSAVVAVQSLRMMSRHGWRQLSSGFQEVSWTDLVGDAGRRLRRRFGDGRDEPS
jgi:hypothetical protein